MKPEQARAIVDWAQHWGVNEISGREARAFFRWLLPHEGWTLVPRGTDLYQRGELRMRLTDLRLKRLRRVHDTWVDVSSQSLIEAAQSFLIEAATQINNQELLGRWTSTTLKKRMRSEASAEAAGFKKLKEQVWHQTLKVAEALDPRARALIQRSALDRNMRRLDQLGAIREAVQPQTEQWLISQADDSPWASVAQPPWTPWVGDYAYTWVEGRGAQQVRAQLSSQSQVRAGRRTAPPPPRVMFVRLGQRRGLDLSPSGEVELAKAVPPGAADVGSVHGVLVVEDAQLHAELSGMMPTDEAGALLLIRTWCRLLSGYGITEWAAAPQTRQLLEAMAAQGLVWVESRGSALRVVCDLHPARRLFVD